MTNETGLHPHFTFKNLVIDKTNELTNAAVQAVLERPGRYNPLLIYGSNGLGKTHILHALGNQMLVVNPLTKVRYVTLEGITAEFVQAARQKRSKGLKEAYCNLNLLMIDDFQFIKGKEGTQNEFLVLFKALHQAGCQVVVCSDMSHKAIPDVIENLISFFETGMVVDMRPIKNRVGA